MTSIFTFFHLFSLFTVVTLGAVKHDPRPKRQMMPNYQQSAGMWPNVGQQSASQSWPGMYQGQNLQQQQQVNDNVQTLERSWPCYPQHFYGYFEYYYESDRCNGDYRCSNSRDENSCPNKCIAPLYSEESFLQDCRNSRQRWQFDPRTQQCRFFVHGGCFRQENLFLTRSECELECLQPGNVVDGTDEFRSARNQIGEDDEGVGLDPWDKGYGYFEEIPITAERLVGQHLCNESVTDPRDQTYYNDTDKCDGIYVCENGKDELNCPEKCSGFRYSDYPDILDCRASIPRFFFNNIQQTCISFNYGGCAEVINQFRSEEECLHECITNKKIPNESINLGQLKKQNEHDKSQVKRLETQNVVELVDDSEHEVVSDQNIVDHSITKRSNKLFVIEYD